MKTLLLYRFRGKEEKSNSLVSRENTYSMKEYVRHIYCLLHSKICHKSIHISLQIVRILFPFFFKNVYTLFSTVSVYFIKKVSGIMLFNFSWLFIKISRIVTLNKFFIKLGTWTSNKLYRNIKAFLSLLHNLL